MLPLIWNITFTEGALFCTAAAKERLKFDQIFSFYKSLQRCWWLYETLGYWLKGKLSKRVLDYLNICEKPIEIASNFDLYVPFSFKMLH